jgi:hypothetical protein
VDGFGRVRSGGREAFCAGFSAGIPTRLVFSAGSRERGREGRVEVDRRAPEETTRLGAGLCPLMNMFLSFVDCTSVRIFAGVFAAAT